LRQELDAPPLGAPVNGVVRLVVVAVHDTTRYYGRPLKSTGADGVVRDHSADYVLFHSLMQRRCSKNDPPVDPADVQVTPTPWLFLFCFSFSRNLMKLWRQLFVVLKLVFLV